MCLSVRSRKLSERYERQTPCLDGLRRTTRRRWWRARPLCIANYAKPPEFSRMPNLVIYIPKDLERRLQEAREDWKEHARVVAVEALRQDVGNPTHSNPLTAEELGRQLVRKAHAAVFLPEDDLIPEAAVTERGERAGSSSEPVSPEQGLSIMEPPRSVTPAPLLGVPRKRTQMCEHRIPATHYCKRCD